MPERSIDTPQELEAALAANVQSRREKLARRVRNQRIRIRIALVLSGCIALFALTAYLIGDYFAARSCALMAFVVFGVTVARKFDQSA